MQILTIKLANELENIESLPTKHLKNIKQLNVEIEQMLSVKVKAKTPESPTSHHLVSYQPKIWITKCHFSVIDAAKNIDSYKDENGKDITHIYSYNKVMSPQDRIGIC